jgi:hypothetical protein
LPQTRLSSPAGKFRVRLKSANWMVEYDPVAEGQVTVAAERKMLLTFA